MNKPVDVTFRLALDFENEEHLNEVLNAFEADFRSPLSLVKNLGIVAVNIPDLEGT